MKTCIKCGETKSLDEFHKDKKGKNSCKVCERERNKKYREANRDKERERKKKYRETHKDEIREYKKKYRETHKEQKREYDKKYRERRKNNPNFMLAKSLRCQTYRILSGKIKPAKTLEMLGCSLEAFRAHLEAQFTEGMSWDNYGTGGWHMDHIRPCASFDLSDPDAVRVCFHFSNYQPMWESENCSKGSLYEGKRYTYGAGV